jgi:predicted HTH transcriptional regulator
MINLPTTIAEIDRMIADDVQEDIHLDYKESPAIDKAKRHEIAKDVSAFANSDGGILIYGVIENNNLPVAKDTGVDHTKYSREWLEQIISSNITPRIDGIRIAPIPISTARSLYAVEIPKSLRAPHQAPDKKYYKRSEVWTHFIRQLKY